MGNRVGDACGPRPQCGHARPPRPQHRADREATDPVPDPAPGRHRGTASRWRFARRGGHRRSAAARHSIVGRLNGCPIRLRSSHIERVELRVSPVIAQAVLGVSPGELHRTVVTIDHLWGRDATRIRQQLDEAISWEARFAVAPDWPTSRSGTHVSRSRPYECHHRPTTSVEADLAWSRWAIPSEHDDAIRHLPPMPLVSSRDALFWLNPKINMTDPNMAHFTRGQHR